MELKKSAQDFLMYSYFGFDVQDLQEGKDCIKSNCVHKAYLDLNRTLSFDDGSAKTQKDKNKYRNKFQEEIETIIIKGIDDYNRDNTFDEWHENTCDQLILAAERSKNIDGNNLIKNGKKTNKQFNYGHAQKWLNMTLKYFWILGILNENISEEELHIPIDNFILQAMYENKNNKLDIKETSKYEQYKFNDRTWSQLQKDDYIKIQKGVKDMISEPLIRWEGKAWIKMAKKRSNK